MTPIVTFRARGITHWWLSISLEDDHRPIAVISACVSGIYVWYIEEVATAPILLYDPDYIT